MVQRNDDSRDDSASVDRDLAPGLDDDDDRLGEAIEEYLALAERDQAPDVEEFLARHEDVKDELRAALEGLELVNGLVGRGGGSASWGPSRGGGSARWLESGHRIAGYRVVRELGRGGMGTVYEAVHVGLDRPVALKVLGTLAAPDSSARRRFLNEAKTAAGLHHTHIVPVFDVGQVGGLCYYAMQRIEGSGLDRVIRHMRRTRPVGAGPAGTSSAEGAGTAGSSSFGSRLGPIWLRVSPGWLWRSPRRPAREASGGAPRSAAGSFGLLPPPPIGDSTATWGSRRIEPGDANESGLAAMHESGVDLTGSRAGLGGLPGRPGPDGSRRIDDPPPFDPPRGSSYFRWVASVGLQAADALSHAHHQGVIHRDVKPSNLLVDAKGNIWVTDFGLARRLADPGLTHHDSLLGTPRYMSPEQARTAGQVDGRTDVYSLGATLYELLTLRPPFDGQSAAELVDQIGRDDPLPPRKIEPRVPRDLETIVLKALAKRPGDRYAGASELGEDLARFLSHAPVKARRIGPAGRLWRVARRHPQLAAVTTTAAAVVLATASFAHIRVLDALRDREHAVVALKRALSDKEEANLKTVAGVRKQYLLMSRFHDQTDDPDRRSRGLELIRSAVNLGLSASERAEFRDEAVKFLVMRDVQTRRGLATGYGGALVFGPQGHRLWVLSEDGEYLSLWDVEGNRQVMQVPLRGESGGNDGVTDATGASAPGRSRDRGGPPGQRRGHVAVAGNWIAAVAPDRLAVTLIDPLSGSPVRRITSPGYTILGMVADPRGRRLVTIEQALENPAADLEAMLGAADLEPPAGAYRVNLWDLEEVDRPLAPLLDAPRRGPSTTRPPLVAISPDGKTIAVAAYNTPFVRLFWSHNGDPRLPRPVDNQSEVSALALGPDGLMAVAGHDQIRLYDIDSPKLFVTSLKPGLSVTRLMRFSPTGALALAGVGGRIELWDPAAASRVASLPGSEQAVDLAFSPDGRTLAAAGRTEQTPIWTIQDSAARTQLSGFDAYTSSLAFGPDGTLAIGGRDGAVSTWQTGRCPESGPAIPVAAAPGRGPSGYDPRPSPRGGGRRGGPGSRGFGPSPQPPDRPTSLAFDDRGRLLAHDSQGLRVWPAVPRAVLSSPTTIALPPPPPTYQFPIASTPDGRVMALLRSSSVYLWRGEAPDRLIPVVPPPGPDEAATRFRTAQIAPGGDRLYLIDFPGRLHVWDLSDSPTIPAIRAVAAALGLPPIERILQAVPAARALPPIENLVSIALRRGGVILAVGDRTGTVTLIDTVRHAIAGTINPPADESGAPPALALSDDGRTLAVGSQQGTISLFDIDRPGRPRLRLRLPGHAGHHINYLAFDATGHRLAGASNSEPVAEVWDLRLIENGLARLGLGDAPGRDRR